MNITINVKVKIFPSPSKFYTHYLLWRICWEQPTNTQGMRGKKIDDQTFFNYHNDPYETIYVPRSLTRLFEKLPCLSNTVRNTLYLTDLFHEGHIRVSGIQRKLLSKEAWQNRYHLIANWLTMFCDAFSKRYLCIRFLARICLLSTSSVWLIGNQPFSSSRRRKPSAQPVYKKMNVYVWNIEKEIRTSKLQTCHLIVCLVSITSPSPI